MKATARLIMAAALAMALAAGFVTTTPAPVEAQQVGLVNVNTGDILSDIALDLDVDISQIPLTVQAPIGIAANVCNVQVTALLAAAQQGDAECDAENTSEAFNRIVQRQM